MEWEESCMLTVSCYNGCMLIANSVTPGVSHAPLATRGCTLHLPRGANKLDGLTEITCRQFWLDR